MDYSLKTNSLNPTDTVLLMRISIYHLHIIIVISRTYSDMLKIPCNLIEHQVFHPIDRN